MATRVKTPAGLRIKIEYWPIAKLIPYDKNPRRNDHAVERMMGAIREFGFMIPMLARSSGDVVDGHLRLKAALALDMRELPVILCDHWTESQIKAFRLQVNKSTEWAEWDNELLAGELIDLKFQAFDLELTGFDPEDIGAVVVDLFDGMATGDKRKLPGESMAENGLKFRVIVEADSEQHQAELIKKFKHEGLKAKPLIS